MAYIIKPPIFLALSPWSSSQVQILFASVSVYLLSRGPGCFMSTVITGLVTTTQVLGGRRLYRSLHHV